MRLLAARDNPSSVSIAPALADSPLQIFARATIRYRPDATLEALTEAVRRPSCRLFAASLVGSVLSPLYLPSFPRAMVSAVRAVLGLDHRR